MHFKNIFNIPKQFLLHQIKNCLTRKCIDTFRFEDVLMTVTFECALMKARFAEIIN